MSIKTTYKITIPSPEGFVGRSCSNSQCSKYFKIATKSIKSEIICPYCSDKKPIAASSTQEQTDYAIRVAKEDIMAQVTSEFSNMFKKLATNNRSKFIKYESKSTPYRKKYVSPPVEYKVDNQINCSICESSFQVYGIFGFCPSCANRNIKIYDANLAIIIQEINNARDKNRALRHAYSDLVSTFEGFCKKYANSDATANFQNLRNAKQYFKKEKSIDIYYGITDIEKTKIKRVFMKRHVYVHPESTTGMISEKFVQEIPEDSPLLGTKAVLSALELEEGADILRRIITNIIK